MEQIDLQTADLEYALQHLDNINTAEDLIKFWNLFGTYKMCDYPYIERYYPDHG